MGASGWSYIVPYLSDIQKAFEALQAEVYQSRDYSSLWTRSEAIQHYKDQLSNVEKYYEDEYTREELIEDLNTRIDRLNSLPEPTSLSEHIDELRAVNAEEGTHSILDMRGIAEEPNYMRVAPLNAAELESLFGTIRPSKETVEQQEELLMGFRRTWMGTYIILFQDDKPHEIMFVGASGD
jgi:hypothetical protein